MTGDQRTIQQWTVRIGGIDQKTVKPGDSIEIGRKPLRPLPDDGTERLEIADGTRSMSKRHATFAVSQNGGGTVRDLGSTNGSYVVRGNGDLMRLPPNVDFLLPTSPMRLQFGDVPVDFIRVEQPVSDTFVVPDLFGYALETVKQEPDVADMSVDDILDLRAGEPTAAISAATVRKRVGELNAVASQTFPPQKTTTADGLAADSAAGAAEPDSELAVSSDAAMPVEAAVLAETVSPAEADAAESDAETKVPEAAESSENAAPADAVDAADAAVSTETATSDTASPETVTSGTVASESAADTVPADSAVSDSVVTAAQSQTNDEPSE
ncbi:FHA domain-containing protein, partial [Bifidobacterium bifidum]|uniref:FHA domain-containing protein n=1 Tax=Bifidobacterium bifidum TaxID=1681 RepID=UPI003B9D1506